MHEDKISPKIRAQSQVGLNAITIKYNIVRFLTSWSSTPVQLKGLILVPDVSHMSHSLTLRTRHQDRSLDRSYSVENMLLLSTFSSTGLRPTRLKSDPVRSVNITIYSVRQYEQYVHHWKQLLEMTNCCRRTTVVYCWE